MGKILSIVNHKGGVGKTTTTLNLGKALSLQQKKVLIIDLDPQANLSQSLGIEEPKKNIYHTICENQEMPIITVSEYLDVVPADLDLSEAEIRLQADVNGYFKLKNALKNHINSYEYILIDCPPSLGILSYISLVAATHVLIPIQTHYKSLKGTELLLRTIARVKARPNKNLKIAGVIPTMHEARTVQGGMALQSIQASKIGTIFPAVPRSVSFADASQEHLPLALHNPKHPAVALFNEIAGSLEALV